MYGHTLARLFDKMRTHGVDFRIKFVSGYELSGSFIQKVGSFLWGGFPGKKVEIAKKGRMYGGKEWPYPN